MLTKKFLNLIENAENGILDLNQAAELLQVRLAGGQGEGKGREGQLGLACFGTEVGTVPSG